MKTSFRKYSRKNGQDLCEISLENNQIADSHLDWARKLKTDSQITKENVDQILQQALVEIFDQVLECAGVFKNNEDGEIGWQKFTDALISEVDR